MTQYNPVDIVNKFMSNGVGSQEVLVMPSFVIALVLLAICTAWTCFAFSRSAIILLVVTSMLSVITGLILGATFIVAIGMVVIAALCASLLYITAFWITFRIFQTTPE